MCREAFRGWRCSSFIASCSGWFRFSVYEEIRVCIQICEIKFLHFFSFISIYRVI